MENLKFFLHNHEIQLAISNGVGMTKPRSQVNKIWLVVRHKNSLFYAKFDLFGDFL